MSIGFPLLLIPFAIYNIFVFVMSGVAFTSPIASVTLMSGVTWTATFGDGLLTLSLVLLLFEVIKAARPGARYLTDHLLSLISFGAAAAEFLLLAPFGTSTFFLLTVLMAVEFLAGLSLALRGRRRVAEAPSPVRDVAPEAPVVERVRSEPKLVEPTFTPPPPVVPPAPETEPAPKPEPPAAVVRPAEAASAQPRKVADWNVADLVSDKEPDGSSGAAPKS
ncbi:MAG TPA: hypothetical protein VF467_03630 [Afipia sp.]